MYCTMSQWFLKQRPCTKCNSSCCDNAGLFFPYFHWDIAPLQMTEKIQELEKAALAEKPWQLSGEVTAQTRPENSMLEEDVDFEQTSRMGG